MNLPFATPDFPGIGGTIKNRPEDFFVQELPLYEASGEGEHVYCEVQKIRLTTFQVIDKLAAALGVPKRDIGYAGMKDAQAVSRQLFSILGTKPEAVMNLKFPDLTVNWAARHRNKLRLGHLAGNRFAIKIRDVNPTDVVKLSPLIARLTTSGMPNYFGDQRFGRRRDNAKLGAALVRDDDKQLLELLLGHPNPKLDDPASLSARTAYDAGEFEKAMKLYPRRCGMERRVLARFIKTGRPGSGVGTIEQRLRRLWVSALQSSLFNQVVARRIASLDRVLPGDLAWKHDNGAVFLVEDAAAEQERAQRFEISPTGPLIGYRLTLPAHEPLATEQEIFASASLTPADFRSESLRVKGARRPLRVQPADVELSAGVDEIGAHITVAFTLPPGSFATVFISELTKKSSQA